MIACRSPALARRAFSRPAARHPWAVRSSSKEAGRAGAPPPPSTALQGLSWPAFLSSLFVSGAVSGTLLDGIHSRTGLQVYEMFPLHIGGLSTSLAVPPLLGAFYLVLGTLYCLLDAALPTPSTQQIQERAGSIWLVVAAAGVLAADLELSAWLYSHDCPFGQISIALALASAATWKLFDGTTSGLGLAAFCALAAPASELVLLRLLPLWSYPAADLDFGEWGTFVSWVPWCYCFYAPVLGLWARYLWQACRSKQ